MERRFLKVSLDKTGKFFLESSGCTKLPHVTLPLLGRFKGVPGESFNFVVVTSKSGSGLLICSWIERVVSLKEKRGVKNGYLSMDIIGINYFS